MLSLDMLSMAGCVWSVRPVCPSLQDAVAPILPVVVHSHDSGVHHYQDGRRQSQTCHQNGSVPAHLPDLWSDSNFDAVTMEM